MLTARIMRAATATCSHCGLAVISGAICPVLEVKIWREIKTIFIHDTRSFYTQKQVPGIRDTHDLKNGGIPTAIKLRKIPTPISETLPRRWRLESPRQIRRSPGPLLRYSVLPSGGGCPVGAGLDAFSFEEQVRWGRSLFVL